MGQPHHRPSASDKVKRAYQSPFLVYIVLWKIFLFHFGNGNFETLTK
jgi:hypothetical protein